MKRNNKSLTIDSIPILFENQLRSKSLSDSDKGNNISVVQNSSVYLNELSTITKFKPDDILSNREIYKDIGQSKNTDYLTDFFQIARSSQPLVKINNKIGTSLTAFPNVKPITNNKNNLPSSITRFIEEETKSEEESKTEIEEEFKSEEQPKTQEKFGLINTKSIEYDIISKNTIEQLKGIENKSNRILDNNKFKYFLSGTTGIGTGLAMMPIFNYELTKLEEFGINIHADKPLFVISTINTLLVNSLDSAISIYRELNPSSKNVLTSKQKTALKIAVGASIIPALLQVSQLWDVELHDKKVSESAGFDEYLAWATFTTIPLLVSQTLKSLENIRSFVKGTLPNVELDTIGSKALFYSTTFLSALGRSIAYTAAIKTLFENLGCEEDFSLGSGIVLGGILGASINGFSEYYSMKSLFAKQKSELSKGEIALGSLCALEGAWFTLPVISEGLDLTKDWDVFLQALIFFPTFLSRMVHESKSLYHNLDIKHSNTEHNSDIQPNLLIEDTILDQDILLVGNNNILFENI